jgi:hypothetical protein
MIEDFELVSYQVVNQPVKHALRANQGTAESIQKSETYLSIRLRLSSIDVGIYSHEDKSVFDERAVELSWCNQVPLCIGVVALGDHVLVMCKAGPRWTERTVRG